MKILTVLSSLYLPVKFSPGRFSLDLQHRLGLFLGTSLSLDRLMQHMLYPKIFFLIKKGTNISKYDYIFIPFAKFLVLVLPGRDTPWG